MTQKKLTRDQLRQRAKELEITGRGSMNKDELEKAVAKVEKALKKARKPIGEVAGQKIIVIGENINDVPAVDFLRSVDNKGTRRQVRKLLRSAGFRNLAQTDVRRAA